MDYTAPDQGVNFTVQDIYSPPQKEGDVESGTVEVDKLKKEHLESKAVVPLGLRPWLLCGG